MKQSADDSFEFDVNSRKLSKLVENTVGKVEIARYEQFLLFPQCFQKACFQFPIYCASHISYLLLYVHVCYQSKTFIYIFLFQTKFLSVSIILLFDVSLRSRSKEKKTCWRYSFSEIEITKDENIIV